MQVPKVQKLQLKVVQINQREDPTILTADVERFLGQRERINNLSKAFDNYGVFLYMKAQ
jgi:hypothetical protein